MQVLQSSLPFAPWVDPRHRRLPGIQPLDPKKWLLVDDAFAGQMAERDRLIGTRPDAVHALDPAALPAAHELLHRVVQVEIARLPGYRRGKGQVTRPDGVRVPIDPDAPLLTLGRLVQEDFCILERRGDEHVMSGAILCFPASWRLDEKFLRPLTAIHAPVAVYDANIAARVQRLFDAIRPEQPLWRANLLAYADPELHQPRSESDRRHKPQGAPDYVRSERQCLLRLPETRAVIFSIHSCVVRRESLDPQQRAALEAMTAQG